MDAIIGRFSAQTYALFRIMAGLMFMLHGTQKILGWPPMQGGPPGGLPPIAIAAGIIELVCGFMIAIGLLAGLAAFIASGQMAFAYFLGHFKMTPGGWNPLVNQGELAVLYCFAFLYMSAHGSGIWSVDAAMRGRKPVTSSTDAKRP